MDSVSLLPWTCFPLFVRLALAEGCTLTIYPA